jgi:3-deoxy-D-manno-octulosonate 8-phosphate phosphatase (KDO 8-P phosphatase)
VRGSLVMSNPIAKSIADRSDDYSNDTALAAQRLQAFVFDVDGVLTDGHIYMGDKTESFKAFSVHDGLGLSWLKQSGLRLGIITGRSSSIVTTRAGELGFDQVIQGQLDKLAGLHQLAAGWNLNLDQIGYCGDDWPDLRALQHCGFAATVCNAPLALKEVSLWISTHAPGQGAVRQLAQDLLSMRGQWAAIEQQYRQSSSKARQ